eukprot:2650832-Pyramimonas_sp.AAC.1
MYESTAGATRISIDHAQSFIPSSDMTGFRLRGIYHGAVHVAASADVEADCLVEYILEVMSPMWVRVQAKLK